MKIEFRTCPNCNGYGVLDSGKNCQLCGGRGRGGLCGKGAIGSGEIMVDKDTGRRITPREFAAMMEVKCKEKLRASQ